MHLSASKRYDWIQVLILRIGAVLEMAFLAVVFLPQASLNAWHVWLGLGPMPDDAVLRYVIRGGAFAQVAIGVLLWMMARDVARFRPLILAVGIILLVCGPAFLLIDATAGMPRFWCLLDGISSLLGGGIISALCLLSAAAAREEKRQSEAQS